MFYFRKKITEVCNPRQKQKGFTFRFTREKKKKMTQISKYFESYLDHNKMDWLYSAYIALVFR